MVASKEDARRGAGAAQADGGRRPVIEEEEREDDRRRGEGGGQLERPEGWGPGEGTSNPGVMTIVSATAFSGKR